MMLQMFSAGQRSGLQAGQFSTWTLLLWRMQFVVQRWLAEISKSFPFWMGALTCISVQVKVCWQTVISGSVPESISDVLERILSVFNAVLLRTWRLDTSSFDLQPFDLLTLLLILWIFWWYHGLSVVGPRKPLTFYIEKHFSETLQRSLSQIDEPLSIFTSERPSLSEMLLLYPEMFLTCCQLTLV